MLTQSHIPFLTLYIFILAITEDYGK